MSGLRRPWSDNAPLLSSRKEKQHTSPVSRSSPSSPSSVEMSTAAATTTPRRSIFLGVDVGTGSARAGYSTPLFSLYFPCMHI